MDPNILAQRIILAYINIGVWTGAKRDKSISQEIAAAKGAANDAGSYTKYLVPKDKLDPVVSTAQAIRTYHYKNTVAWDDHNARALPVERWFEYQAGLEFYIDKFRTAVEEFSAWYAENWNAHQVRLGSMFDPKEYPYPDEVAGKFKLQTSYRQISTLDFRVQLPPEIDAAVKKSSEDGFNNGIKMATAECWGRICEMMLKVHEKLADPKGVFRDSLIENINILVETLTPLNIGGNHELKTILEEIKEKLGGCFPDWLRVDPAARATAASAARNFFERSRLHCE